jgi:hypothetical protein
MTKKKSSKSIITRLKGINVYRSNNRTAFQLVNDIRVHFAYKLTAAVQTLDISLSLISMLP